MLCTARIKSFGNMADSRGASLTTFIVSCACATLSLMTSVSFVIFHTYHRNNRIVRMSSPRLNIIISAGCMGLSVTCLLYGLDFIMEDNLAGLSPLCQIRVWLLIMSMTLIFGPVTAKTWRVWRIFEKRGSKVKVVIRDFRLILMVGGVLLVDILFLILWQAIDPPVSNLTSYSTQTLDNGTSEIFRNTSVVIQECVCNKMEVWVTMALLWKLIMLSYGLHLAWKVKDVAVPPLNDSPSVIVAIFGTVTLGGAVGMVTCFLREFPTAVYILTSLCIGVAVVLIQLALFVPKVIYWWKVPSDMPLKISTPSLRDVTCSSEVTENGISADENGNSFHDDGILQLVQENQALRESVSQKEVMIGELQTLVTSAREKLASLAVDVEMDPADELNIDALSTNAEDEIFQQYHQVSEYRLPDLQTRISRYQEVELPVSRMQSDEDDDSETDHAKELASIYEPRNIGEILLQEAQLHSRHGFMKRDRDKHPNFSVSIRSSSSRNSLAEIYELRNAIEADLSSAAAVTSNLQRSLSRDLDRSISETDWLFQSHESKDLTESISRSYDLDGTDETKSFISSYIPRGNSLYQIQRARKRMSINSLHGSDNLSYGNVELDSLDNIFQHENPSAKNTGSSTPDSQHHAATLRYYAYRHVKDNKLLQVVYPRRRRDSITSQGQSVTETDNLDKSADFFEQSATSSVFTTDASQGPPLQSVGETWRAPVDAYDSFV